MSTRRKSQNPSVSSDERKNYHGSTAPHGGTSRGKTHIGGNSLGTCTQGSTSPPATGQRSPGKPRPTHRPIAQWTRRHIWPTGHQPPGIRPMDKKAYLADRAYPVTGHRKCPGPGMPGHRVPATGHSPTTGQTGDIETSSLPITGHRPSNHWSLELERLNPAEIKESSATGHDRSPGSRSPITGYQNIIQTTSSEAHTFGTEFTNEQPSTSEVLLPLEPDFSNMSDPSVVIEPPDNNWRSDNNNDNYRQIQTSLSGRRSRRDQSRYKHRSKERRIRRSASTSSSSNSSS